MVLKKLKKIGLKPKVPRVVRDIHDVQDLDENTVSLFYGKAGRGKTHTAATFPTTNLFLDINNERGLKTVKQIDGIRVANVNDWEDFLEMHTWLKQGQNFKTITLDQITGLQDLAQREVRLQFRMTPDEPFEGFKKWGALSGEMKTWLQAYRELSPLYNITFLAHERVFGDEGEAEANDLAPTVGARAMPSVGSFVDGACGIIGQSFIRMNKVRKDGKIVRTPQYCMRVGPHPTYVTKIRRPAAAGPLPDYIVNPSYRKLMALEAGEEISSTTKKITRRV